MAVSVTVTLTLLLPPSLLNNIRVLFVFSFHFVVFFLFLSLYLFGCFFIHVSFACLIFFIRQLDYLPCSCAMCIWCRFVFTSQCKRGTTVQLCACAWFTYSFHCVLSVTGRAHSEYCLHFRTKIATPLPLQWRIFKCIERIGRRALNSAYAKRDWIFSFQSLHSVPNVRFFFVLYVYKFDFLPQ